jgi:hypothetical protein
MSFTIPILRLASVLAGAAFVASAACAGGDTKSDTQTAEAGVGVEAAAAQTPADAYAPVLPVPKDVPDDPGAKMMAMAMRGVQVPSKSEVGVPAYPDARVMSTMAGQKMMANDEEVEMLPALALLSGDTISDVLAFYTKKLKGWHQKEFFGSYMFWDGPPDADPLDITLPYPLVAIMPLAESGSERTLWPNMKTRIDIRYKPSGG